MPKERKTIVNITLFNEFRVKKKTIIVSFLFLQHSVLEYFVAFTTNATLQKSRNVFYTCENICMHD